MVGKLGSFEGYGKSLFGSQEFGEYGGGFGNFGDALSDAKNTYTKSKTSAINMAKAVGNCPGAGSLANQAITDIENDKFSSAQQKMSKLSSIAASNITSQPQCSVINGFVPILSAMMSSKQQINKLAVEQGVTAAEVIGGAAQVTTALAPALSNLMNIFSSKKLAEAQIKAAQAGAGASAVAPQYIPMPAEKDNTMLIVGIVAAVLIVGVLVMMSKKGGSPYGPPAYGAPPPFARPGAYKKKTKKR